MYLIVMNGPPYSGKDTLAQLVLEHIESFNPTTPIKLESLSLPLRSIAYAMVGRVYMTQRTDEWNRYAEFKEEYFPSLERTGRQLMIDASEQFLKLNYGIEVMAKLLEARNKDFPRNGVMIIRDGGFQIEIEPLIRWVGAENVMIVRVSRPACTFKGDSRESVYHPYERMNMEICNDSDLDYLRTEAGRLYGRLVNSRGWKF